MTTATSASRLWSELETVPISLGVTPRPAATAAVSTVGGAREAFAELLRLLVTVKLTALASLVRARARGAPTTLRERTRRRRASLLTLQSVLPSQSECCTALFIASAVTPWGSCRPNFDFWTMVTSTFDTRVMMAAGRV